MCPFCLILTPAGLESLGHPLGLVLVLVRFVGGCFAVVVAAAVSAADSVLVVAGQRAVGAAGPQPALAGVQPRRAHVLAPRLAAAQGVRPPLAASLAPLAAVAGRPSPVGLRLAAAHTAPLAGRTQHAGHAAAAVLRDAVPVQQAADGGTAVGAVVAAVVTCVCT